MADMDDPDLWREQQRFYNFLHHYDLQQYHQAFLAKGVSKISHLKSLDEESLAEIGLSRPERIRLMKKTDANFSRAGKFKKAIMGKAGRFDTADTSSAFDGRSFSLSRLGEPYTHQTASLIAKEEIQLGKKLGEGVHGSVWEGVWSNVHGSVAVAVKTLYGREEVQTSFIKEADSMRALNHPNIIRLYGIVLSSPLMLVEELAPLGSLHEYLITKGKTLSVRLFHSYACQIASAMKYLEERRIVHRDLAARNILLVAEDYVKLSDFGMARALDQHSDVYNLSNLQTKIPIAWTALEALTRAKFSTASDVWSYGVTLWEIYSLGRTPWEGLSPIEIRDKLEGGDRLGRPERCSPEIFTIILSCWEHNPQDRPNFATIANKLEPLASKVVRAMQAHTVIEDTHSLSFKKGDLIYVIDRPKPEWIFGMKAANGDIGHFLADHVTNVINPIGQLKEQLHSGKSKVSELPISKPMHVTHDYHWGLDGKKWSIDSPEDEEQAALAGKRKHHTDHSSGSSRTGTPLSRGSGPSPRPHSPSYDPVISRSPSPAPHGDPTRRSPVPPLIPPSATSRPISQYSVIRQASPEFVGRHRYVPQAISGGPSGRPSNGVGSGNGVVASGVSGSANGSASYNERPEFSRRVSEDEDYVSITGMLRIGQLEPVVGGATAADTEEEGGASGDSGYHYLRMDPCPTGLQRQFQGRRYENLLEAGLGLEEPSDDRVVSLGQFRENVTAYAVSRPREEVRSSESGSEEGTFSPTNVLEDMSHINPAALPRPLIPISHTPQITSAAHPRPMGLLGLSNVPYTQASAGLGDYNPFLANERVTSATDGFLSSSEPSGVTSGANYATGFRYAAAPPMTTNQVPPTQNGHQATGAECNLQRSISLQDRKLHRSPGQRRKVGRGRSASPFDEIEEAVSGDRQPLVGRKQPDSHHPPRGLTIIPAASSQTSSHGEGGVGPQPVPIRDGYLGVHSLQAVLMSEFPETSADLCKQALEVHHYNIERARQEVKIHQLLGIQIPYITIDDCRRALSHCQGKVDRAAEWLLGQSEEIAAKRA